MGATAANSAAHADGVTINKEKNGKKTHRLNRVYGRVYCAVCRGFCLNY